MNNKQTLVIESGRIEHHYWRDLWRYRELFVVLAWRDIAVRYKQTTIGIIWALIQPLMTMVVFTFVFGNIAKLPAEGVAPYWLMVLIALLPWQLFSSSLSGAGSSLIGNSNLISKVYFPRMIVPSSAIAVSIVDFLIGLVVLAVMMVWNQFIPGWRIVFLPLFITMAILASLGPSLWISALNVKYRDFRYIIPFIVQLGLYISPVGFSSGVVPEKLKYLYSLNPMVGVIDGFRWCLLDGNLALDYVQMTISWIVILAALWVGVRRFRKMEKHFADLI